MSETATETTSTNGTAPADPAPCQDCATGGEKLLAILAGAFGLFIILMAVDMATGGKVTGLVKAPAGD